MTARRAQQHDSSLTRTTTGQCGDLAAPAALCTRRAQLRAANAREKTRAAAGRPQLVPEGPPVQSASNDDHDQKRDRRRPTQAEANPVDKYRCHQRRKHPRNPPLPRHCFPPAAEGPSRISLGAGIADFKIKVGEARTECQERERQRWVPAVNAASSTFSYTPSLAHFRHGFRDEAQRRGVARRSGGGAAAECAGKSPPPEPDRARATGARWRRRESNPRPRTHRSERLQA